MGYRCRWIASHHGTMARVTLKLRLARDQKIDEAIYDPGLYGHNTTLTEETYLPVYSLKVRSE